jgi:hypothetical protein
VGGRLQIVRIVGVDRFADRRPRGRPIAYGFLMKRISPQTSVVVVVPHMYS